MVACSWLRLLGLAGPLARPLVGPVVPLLGGGLRQSADRTDGAGPAALWPWQLVRVIHGHRLIPQLASYLSQVC